MLVDTHCHLDFDLFDQDREETLARAAAAGVVKLLNPAIDLESSRSVVGLAQAHEEVYACVGVHPNEANSWTDETLDELRALGREPRRVAAIGEIGLDYYRDRARPDLQQKIFREQLRLARELELPVVIHTRDTSPQDRQATEDALTILKEWQADLAGTGSPLAERPGVLHSFSAGPDEAERAREINFFIGITGPVTFKNASHLQAVVARMPIEQLLIETDAPFLTPHPYRGRRNEPAYVRFVAEKIAEIKNLPYEMIASMTTMNAKRLFNW